MVAIPETSEMTVKPNHQIPLYGYSISDSMSGRVAVCRIDEPNPFRSLGGYSAVTSAKTDSNAAKDSAILKQKETVKVYTLGRYVQSLIWRYRIVCVCVETAVDPVGGHGKHAIPWGPAKGSFSAGSFCLQTGLTYLRRPLFRQKYFLVQFGLLWVPRVLLVRSWSAKIGFCNFPKGPIQLQGTL